MRTKVLLGLAAIAVSAATCVAQSNVYSLNIVGYVNVDVVKGMNLISNPLKPSNGNYNITNTLVLPDAMDASSIYKWAGTSWNPDVPSWVSGAGGGWDTPLNLDLGQAFFLSATAPGKITFVGEVATGNIDYTVPPGVSYIAPKTPVAQHFPGNVGNDGDAIYTWAGTGWSSTSWGYIAGVGWDASDPAVANLDGPLVPIGGGIVYQNLGKELKWTKTFNP